MRTPHYEHDSRIIEPRKCGKDRVRERPDQGNRIERFLHLGRQIIRVSVLPLQFFPCHCLAPAWSDEKASSAERQGMAASIELGVPALVNVWSRANVRCGIFVL